MKNTQQRKKRWFLKVELAVLVCVICIWVVKLVTVDIDSTKAAVFKQVVKIRPNSADAHANLGEAYYYLGNYEGAIEAYKEAIRLDPNWPWTHCCLAFTYQDLQRYEEAIKEWKQVIKLEPDIAGLHSILGKAYLKTGNKDLALEQYEILKTLDEELANELHGLLQEQL